VPDKRLWTAIAKATRSPGNSTALVAVTSRCRVAAGIFGLGVSTLLIRGFSPLEDARDTRLSGWSANRPTGAALAERRRMRGGRGRGTDHSHRGASGGACGTPGG